MLLLLLLLNVVVSQHILLLCPLERDPSVSPRRNAHFFKKLSFRSGFGWPPQVSLLLLRLVFAAIYYTLAIFRGWPKRVIFRKNAFRLSETPTFWVSKLAMLGLDLPKSVKCISEMILFAVAKCISFNMTPGRLQLAPTWPPNRTPRKHPHGPKSASTNFGMNLGLLGF